MVITSLKTNIKYAVQWEPHGYSYAIPMVYKPVLKTFLFFEWTTLKRVWKGPTRCCLQAEKMLPPKMIEWFKQAVIEYENYIEEWSKSKLYEILSSLFDLEKIIIKPHESILLEILNDKSKTKALLYMKSEDDVIAKFAQYIIKN